MKLQEIMGAYDVAVGLGSWCGPAIHLRRHRLRKASFPLDWVQSQYLAKVNHLLENRFEGYMKLENMVKKDIQADFVPEGNVVFDANGKVAKAHFIHDSFYCIDSVHDFQNFPNQDWKVQYPTFREKLDTRIERFLTTIKQSQSTLFIRYEWADWSPGKLEDIKKLYSILSQLTNGNFKLLIMQSTLGGVKGLQDMNFSSKDICLIAVPREHPSDNAIWDQVLQGITVAD